MYGHKSGLRIGDRVLQHIYQDEDGRCAIGTVTGFNDETKSQDIEVTFDFMAGEKVFREYFYSYDLTPIGEEQWT